MDTVTFTNADIEWLIHMRDNHEDFETMFSKHGEEVIEKVVSTGLIQILKISHPKTLKERSDSINKLIYEIETHYLKVST